MTHNAEVIQAFDWRIHQIDQLIKSHQGMIYHHEDKIKKLQAQRDAVFQERIQAMGIAQNK